MSIFSHAQRTIPYQIAATPWVGDWLLLQSSRQRLSLWTSVVECWQVATPAPGRALFCDWFEAGFETRALVDDLYRMLQTLGFDSLKVVACEDAVPVLRELQKIEPGLVRDSLCFADSTPAIPQALADAIRNFAQTSRDP